MDKNFQPFTMSLIEDIEAGNAKIDGGGDTTAPARRKKND